jgi:hypothetical protein
MVRGPNSDHDPVVLKLMFGYRKHTAPLKLSKPRIAWHKLDDWAAEFKDATIEKLKELLKKGAPSSKAFSKTIVQIAEKMPQRQSYDEMMVCGV